MSAPGRITPGDYLRASRHVDADDAATRQAIAESLGFTWASAGAARPAAVRAGPGAWQDEGPERPTVTPERVMAKVPAVERLPVPERENEAWVQPLPVAPGTGEEPEWYRQAAVLPPQSDGEPEKAPGIEPLLEPRWTRALFQALLATAGTDENAPPDLDRAIERLARGEALARLPRLPRPRLAGGVQVLLDHSPAMTPFAEDQQELLKLLARFILPALVQEVHFENTPDRVMPGGTWEAGPYRPPAAGTPVLALTMLDAAFPALGGGTAARTAAWRRLARTVAQAGCRLVALLPTDPARVSPALRQRLAVVPWDRTTTTGQVTRARRAAAQREAAR